MTSPGLRVARFRGEETRRALREAGRLDTGRVILKEGEFLVLPLTEGPLPAGLAGEPVEREFAPVGRPGPSDYRELLPWPSAEKRRLPRSFDVVGDIVLVRLPEELEDRRAEVGTALLAFVPSARLVGVDRGVQGPERRRRVERVAGAGPWRTRHRENGIEYDVDVEAAYFSPRLAREHARVAADVARGDRVYDLACGVGPFSITVARDGRARAVTAVDRNPAAVELLRATLGRYPFGVRVTVVEAPLEAFLPSAEPRERVVLNLPHEGIKYLPSVARVVAPRGRLYYYQVTPREGREASVETVVQALGPGADWTLRELRAVHPYSPTSDLAVFVLDRGSA